MRALARNSWRIFYVDVWGAASVFDVVQVSCALSEGRFHGLDAKTQVGAGCICENKANFLPHCETAQGFILHCGCPLQADVLIGEGRGSCRHR